MSASTVRLHPYLEIESTHGRGGATRAVTVHVPDINPEKAMKTIYCLGFAFTPDEQVVLVRHPAAHPNPALRDRWNGVGGRIRSREPAVEAMSRKYVEEVGGYVHPSRWEEVALVVSSSAGYRIHVFRAFLHPTEAPDYRSPARLDDLPLVEAFRYDNNRTYVRHTPALASLARHRAPDQDPVVLSWDPPPAHPHAPELAEEEEE